MSTQESFFADSSKYGVKASIEAAPYQFKPSGDPATVSFDVAGDATGWSAKVTNSSVSTAQKDCYVFGGSGTAATTHKGSKGPTQDGVPYCGA